MNHAENYQNIVKASKRTEAEDALEWQIRHAGLKEPLREYRFDLLRKWRFDFAYPDIFLGIEVEGGIWTKGRHTRGSGFEADCEKYAEAALQGWRLIRVTPHMIDDGRALKYIERILDPNRIQIETQKKVT